MPSPFYPTPLTIDGNGPLKILVVDDTPKHLRAARILLKDHDVRTFSSFKAAYGNMLAVEAFHIVLTDLWMPFETRRDDESEWQGIPVPCGQVLARFAVDQEVPKVAIVSFCHEGRGYKDFNHGHPLVQPFAHMLDSIPGKLWRFEYHNCPKTEIDGEEVKNWKAVLDIILEEK